MLNMKIRPRIYYTEEQKALMWDRLQKGESLSSIAGLFDLLCEVPIPHKRFLVDDVDDVALAANWRTIELNRHGDIEAVHINERTMAPLDTTAELIEPVYRALREILSLVYDAQAFVQYRLEPGQAVVMDNHRVLHARTAFDGNRHIRQCHVDRDEFFSRLRALRRRRDSEPRL